MVTNKKINCSHWLLILCLMVVSTAQAKQNCLQRIIAFDIGSGSTKISIGRVNACKAETSPLHVNGTTLQVYKNVEKVDLENLFQDAHYPSSFKVDYGEDVNTHGRILPETLEKGRNAIKIYLEWAKLEKNHYNAQHPNQHYHDRIVGVATAAFRSFQENERRNAKQALKKLKEMGFDELSIISQETEAALGFVAAVSESGVDQINNTLVWDIGGKSMQMIAADANNNLQVVGASTMASIDFRLAVLQQVKPQGWVHRFSEADIAQAQAQAKNPDTVVLTSQAGNPNPIDESQIQTTIALSQRLAEQVEYNGIRTIDWLNNNPIEQVLCIGGVFKYGGYKRLNSLGITQDNRINVEAMQHGVEAMVDYNAMGDYTEGNVSNMYLILGHMQAFGFQEAICTGSTMSDALLYIQ